MSHKKEYLINVLSQGGGRVFSMAVNFAVFVFVARVLGADAFGQFSYIITFLMFFATFADFGTQVVLAKDIAQVKDNASVYWGNFLALRLSLVLVVGLIAVGVGFVIRQDLFQWLLLGCLFLPLITARFFDPVFQVYGRPWYSAGSSVFSSVVYLFFVGSALVGWGTVPAVLIAYLLSQAVYTVALFALSRKLIKPRFAIDKMVFKKILLLSIPLGIGSVYTIINSRADIFMLAFMKGDHEVGIYNAAYRFLDLIAVLASTLMIPIIPLFARWAKEDRTALKRNYTRFMETLTIGMVPVALVMPFISGPLIKTLFTGEYMPAAGVLNILVWDGVLIFYALVSSAVNLAVEDIRHAYWNGAVAATINIVLNLMWIPKYSFIGSSWATVISEIALLGVCVFHVVRNLGNVIDVRQAGKIFLALGVLTAFLYAPAPQTGAVLKVLMGIVVYALLIAVLKPDCLKVITTMFSKRLQPEG